MQIDVWSDVVCPWCYIGKRRLESALAGKDITVHWHAFELDPSTPAGSDVNIVEHIAQKYRKSPAEAKQMVERTASVAAADGIEMHFDRVKRVNTFDAHRVIQHAQLQGHGSAMTERLMRAYFTDGVAISDTKVLAELATEIGVKGVTELLATKHLTTEVRTDEAVAKELGISGVPFFVFGQKVAVSGAQPIDVLQGAMAKAVELGTT